MKKNDKIKLGLTAICVGTHFICPAFAAGIATSALFLDDYILNDDDHQEHRHHKKKHKSKD